MKIRTSVFWNSFDNVPKPIDTMWDELVELWQLASTVERPVTQYEKERRTMAFSPAEYKPGTTRAKNNVLAWHWAGFDVDNDRTGATYLSFDAVEKMLQSRGYAYCLHTTTKSTHQQHRFRILLPVSRPISMDEYDAVWDAFDCMFDRVFDHKTRNPDRFFYVPAEWKGSYCRFSALTAGQSVDIDRLKVAYSQPSATARNVQLPGACIPSQPVRQSVCSAVDPLIATDLDLSPLVIDQMRSEYAAANPGSGRFYKFMVQVAGRAQWLGYAVTAEEVERLALDLDRRIGPRKDRPNSLGEARNAIAYVMSNSLTGQGLSTNRRLSKWERLQRKR